MSLTSIRKLVTKMISLQHYNFIYGVARSQLNKSADIKLHSKNCIYKCGAILHICRYLTHNIFCTRTSLMYNYTMYNYRRHHHGWFPRGPYGPWGGGYPSPFIYPYGGFYPPPPIYPPFFR